MQHGAKHRYSYQGVLQLNWHSALTPKQPAPDLSKPRPKAKSSTAKARKDASGLGRAIINRRAKEHKRLYEEALHTTELPSGLHSVTQENDLDEFLNTAQLAATDFSAGACTSTGADMSSLLAFESLN